MEKIVTLFCLASQELLKRVFSILVDIPVYRYLFFGSLFFEIFAIHLQTRRARRIDIHFYSGDSVRSESKTRNICPCKGIRFRAKKVNEIKVSLFDIAVGQITVFFSIISYFVHEKYFKFKEQQKKKQRFFRGSGSMSHRNRCTIRSITYIFFLSFYSMALLHLHIAQYAIKTKWLLSESNMDELC